MQWPKNVYETSRLADGRQSVTRSDHNVLFLSSASLINYSKSYLIRYSEVKTESWCILLKHSPALIVYQSVRYEIQFQETMRATYYLLAVARFVASLETICVCVRAEPCHRYAGKHIDTGGLLSNDKSYRTDFRLILLFINRNLQFTTIILEF